MIKANGAQVKCDLCGFEWFQTPTLHSLGAYLQVPPANKEPQGIYLYQHLCNQCARLMQGELKVMLVRVKMNSEDYHAPIKCEPGVPNDNDSGARTSSVSSSPSQPQSEVPASTSPSER